MFSYIHSFLFIYYSFEISNTLIAIILKGTKEKEILKEKDDRVREMTDKWDCCVDDFLACSTKNKEPSSQLSSKINTTF